MSDLHFKCIFPSGYFDNTPIILKINKSTEDKLFSGEPKTVHVENKPRQISLRVHQHRVKLILDSKNTEDRFFVIRWKGKSELQRYISALGFRGFEIVEVDKMMYSSFDYNYYKTSPRAESEMDRFSLFGIILLSLFFGYQSFYGVELTDSLKEYTLFLFFIGMATTASVYFDRKRISLFDARWRFFSVSILNLILVIWLAWESYEGTWLLFLPIITLVFRSGIMVMGNNTSKSKVSIHED